ncbi:MAG: hypothetical protein V7K77_14730 [Nostoc sp.]
MAVDCECRDLSVAFQVILPDDKYKRIEQAHALSGAYSGTLFCSKGEESFSSMLDT